MERVAWLDPYRGTTQLVVEYTRVLLQAVRTVVEVPLDHELGGHRPRRRGELERGLERRADDIGHDGARVVHREAQQDDGGAQQQHFTKLADDRPH